MTLSQNLQKWFLYLLPLSLFLGNGLIEVTICIISILFVCECINEKKLQLFKQPFFLTIVALWLYMIIRSLFADNTLESLTRSLPFIRFPIFALAVQNLLSNNMKLLNNFIKAFIATIMFVACNLILQHLLGYNVFGVERVMQGVHHYRLTTLNGKMIPGILIATICFPAICHTFSQILRKKCSKLVQYTYVFFLISSFFAVLLSGERMAFLVMLSGYGLVFIYMIRKNFKIVACSILTLALIVIGSVNIFPQVLNRQIMQSANEIKGFEQASYFKIYKSTYELIKINPIFGVGTKNFRYACKQNNIDESAYRCGTHPHNIYLELLVENGVIGLTLFLAFLFFIIKNIVSHFNYILVNPIYYGAFINFLFKILPFVSSGSLYMAWVSIPFWLMVGILCGTKYEKGLT